jgi:hypothetical protein
MQRKTAVRRLGKQIEMGEAFHRAELIESAQIERGSIASALDVITDGEASRALGGDFKSEVMRQLPPAPPPERPKSSAAKATAKPPVEVAANPTPTPTSTAGSALPASSSSPASGGSASPQSGAGSSPAATGGTSSSSKLDEAKAKVEAKAANPTSPASNTAPSASTGSASTPTTASGADSGFGTPTAAEPSAAQVEEAASDDGFDVSFGNDADEQAEPAAASNPETPAQWLAALATWQAAHATKDLVKAGRQEWQDLMRGWLASCPDKATMDAGKEAWTTFSTKWFTKSVPGNPTKGIAAFTGDPEVDEMKDMFARRWKAVPDGAR